LPYEFNEPLEVGDFRNTTKIIDFSNTIFNQPINWQIINGNTVNAISDLFKTSGLSVDTWDNILINFASYDPFIVSNVNLGEIPVSHTATAQTAFDTLTLTYGWTMTELP
jgi:hypothetical protein